MLICTTNAADRLPAAMLRSGRIGNTILVYDAPDADAARELVQRYLGKFAPVGAGDYDSECAGLLPASIKEVAMKAISHALVRGENGVLICDIQECARVVRAQEEFLKSAEKPDEVKPQRMQVELVVPQDAKHGALEGLSEAQRVLGSRNGNGAKQLAP
jgi:SpoVK/Ycf46/Vps4 family AAA+-type ATPase